ncbi:MAG: hypothetical protein IJT21_04400 [Synergistaceae bacterium]|nr:hypothetical protein [Synergistaceae bacterium]
MLTFRQALESEKKIIEDILTLPFMDYPFFKIFEPDTVKREKFIRSLQSIEINTNLKRGQLFAGIDENGKIVLAATFHNPNIKQAGNFEYLCEGYFSAMIKCGFSKILSWAKMYDFCRKPLETLPKPLYYFENLTVRTDSQGKGCGGQFIKNFLLPYVKQNGGGTIAFITNSESNVKFYTNKGFQCFNYDTYSYKNIKLENWCFKMEVK